MKRVLLSQAGGRIGLGFTRSLRQAPEPFYLIGIDANEFHVMRAQTDERHLVPRADQEHYLFVLQSIIGEAKPDLLWVQHEAEIAAVSKAANRLGVLTFLPSAETILLCQDKLASYTRLSEVGVPVPASLPLQRVEDLRRAFVELGPSLWLRGTRGVAGRGSLPVNDFETARKWVDFLDGWGRFMAAERLSERTATWESIWSNGRLVAAQAKRRMFWEFPNLTFSGVTGIAGAHQFITDPAIDEIGTRAVQAVDPRPHGLFGVDLTYDWSGMPRVTEINAGRFQSGGVIHAPIDGFNLPYLAVQAAFNQVPLDQPPLMNLLPSGLVVIQGLDTEPILTYMDQINRLVEELGARSTALQPKV